VAEVRDIMGEPVAIDTFNAQRWNYIYTLQINGGKIKKRSITLVFKNDHLKRIYAGGLSGQPTKHDRSPRDHHRATRKKV